jgi:hypothetical protein
MLEGEVIVLDHRSWAYLSLNDSGAVLWTRLVDGATRSELAAALTGAFEVEEARARDDVDRFVETLVEHDLLAAGA